MPKNKRINKRVKIRYCKGISKYIGLMLHKKIKNEMLIFEFNKEKILPVHMVFVFFPIDVLWLDKKRKVVEIKKNLKPFTFYTPKNKADYIIELPANFVKENKIKVSDKIYF